MPAPERPVCPLTLAAWYLGGLTLGDLWKAYCYLGGSFLEKALADYLDGLAVWPDPEHNVLAQALDEALWDVGLPSLAPHRGPGAATRGAAPGTPRPPP